MKKIMCIAIIAMSGIVLVSCDADGVEGNAPQFGKVSNQKEIYSSTRRIGDSIPADSTLTNLVVDPPPPGPGDDPIPVPPPPKP